MHAIEIPEHEAGNGIQLLCKEQMANNMRVVIVHYWLVGMRGGERVLEAICELYPEAVIVTHVADKSQLSEKILQHEIRETFISKLPGARRHYQMYLPFMPLALELVDLSEFDLVISSESGPAKGVICRPDAVHVCYCHSPMRYIWDHFHLYWRMSGWATRFIMPLLAHKLRIWDVTTSARVDKFLANSNFVGMRVKTYYRREAEVINPPVAVNEFHSAPSAEVGSHYLLAGELVSYKRADIAIEAFTRMGIPLRVIGDGEQRLKLEKIAGNNIKFLGRVPFNQLKEEFSRCKALIFPGEEDFGIIPVEVMAAGRPVIAYGRGGVLDTILPNRTGKLFYEQTSDSLEIAVRDFEQNLVHSIDEVTIISHARKFSTEAFKTAFKKAVDRAIVEKLGLLHKV